MSVDAAPDDASGKMPDRTHLLIRCVRKPFPHQYPDFSYTKELSYRSNFGSFVHVPTIY
jgi:hypothetical protein